MLFHKLIFNKLCFNDLFELFERIFWEIPIIFEVRYPGFSTDKS